MKKLLLVALLVLCAVPVCRADSFPVTGRGFNEAELELSLTGPGFSLETTFNEGFPILVHCGEVCKLSVPFVFSSFAGQQTSGSFNGQAFDLLLGQLVFDSIAQVPLTPIGTPLSGTSTFTVAGNLRGFPGTSSSSDPPVFDIAIGGSGILDWHGIRISDGAFLFQGEVYAISGVATTIPEPASLALMGSGLLALTWRLRRRFWS